MFKKILVSSLLLGGILSAVPAPLSFSPMVLTVSAAEISPIEYDAELSLVVIKPCATGTTYFSYKINGEYPKFTQDKVCYFNEDGSLKEEKTGMLDQPMFSDDISTWIDVTKTTPAVPHESEYYNRLRARDCDVVLPYSETNETNEFYIPVSTVGTNITVNVINVSEDGTVSEVQSNDFMFMGVSIEEESEINASVKSVSKDSWSETVKISGDNISYVQLGSELYESTKNSVEIELTSNGEKTFLVYGQDAATPEVLTYTVEGLGKIEEEVVDLEAPVITSDRLPKNADKSFKFRVYTNEPCTISSQGVSTHGTELEFEITKNGEYLVCATDESGNYSEKKIKVECFNSGSRDSAYELDRDNYWGEDKITLTELPKTGGVSLAGILAICVACVAGGLTLLKKVGKKNEE